ncbi:uncharacterized protein A4U43_C03F22040 [Asparagus officinalis]|uniref:Calcium uniporter protein C-terminal domain-containing protein n=1 Tax=Asparagus officinalis TaxID=4686 RepID=A0A5P1FEV3_ASPOF|nr:calcium uniporter protein 2, mitochondrial-like [Asparagus officinalis]ONK75927.1 uncharacterized protein A4U43_C03F22040 [Asparagus officinalis]
MAYRKTITNRFFNMAKSSFSFSSRTTTTMTFPPFINNESNGSEEHRGFLRGLYPYLPAGDKLVNRIQASTSKGEDLREGVNYISITDTKKVLRASQVEAVRRRLRGIPNSQVSYSEFVGICSDVGGGFEPGMSVAKLLDDSGAVIVLGNVVFLRPDQVARAIESVMPLPTPKENKNDPRVDELRAMEEEKAEIDVKAEALVRRELWCGLGLLLLQTTGFMRLTFWELSWDVMEPICFYVTSVYFMASYAFFLRTSREPSFEGFFESRFSAKQKRLMKTQNFDMERFNELRKACHGQQHKDKNLPSVNNR